MVEDLKARAWAAAGEARRRQGDLAGAEAAVRAAASRLAHGTGDLLVEARLLEFEAAVRRDQRRGGEAAALLKLAAARYRESRRDGAPGAGARRGEASCAACGQTVNSAETP